MSTQHTPGDWNIGWDGKRHVIHDNTALQRHIAYTSDGGVPDDEAWANALLFRAAPDLLKELRNLRRRFHAACIHAGSDEWAATAACADADAAIAKATTL
jgi:hypothetical protein